MTNQHNREKQNIYLNDLDGFSRRQIIYIGGRTPRAIFRLYPNLQPIRNFGSVLQHVIIQFIAMISRRRLQCGNGDVKMSMLSSLQSVQTKDD